MKQKTQKSLYEYIRSRIACHSNSMLKSVVVCINGEGFIFHCYLFMLSNDAWGDSPMSIQIYNRNHRMNEAKFKKIVFPNEDPLVEQFPRFDKDGLINRRDYQFTREQSVLEMLRIE